MGLGSKFASAIKRKHEEAMAARNKPPQTSYDQKGASMTFNKPSYEIPDVLKGKFDKQRASLAEQKAGALASGRRAWNQRLALQGLGGSGAGLKAEAQLQADLANQEQQGLQQIGEQEAQLAYQHGTQQQQIELQQKGLGLQEQQIQIAWQELDETKKNSVVNAAQVAKDLKEKHAGRIKEYITAWYGADRAADLPDYQYGGMLGYQKA